MNWFGKIVVGSLVLCALTPNYQFSRMVEKVTRYDCCKSQSESDHHTSDQKRTCTPGPSCQACQSCVAVLVTKIEINVRLFSFMICEKQLCTSEHYPTDQFHPPKSTSTA